jgi:hypothetical protein
LQDTKLFSKFETTGDLPKDRTIDFQCVGWVGSFSSLRSLELFDLPGIQIRDGSFLNQFKELGVRAKVS